MKMSRIILIFSLIILLISCNKKLYVGEINSVKKEVEDDKKTENILFSATSTRYGKVLFLGLDNSIQITHNFKDSVHFEVDNGRIEMLRESEFVINPTRLGDLNLTVYTITESGNKIVVIQNFRVLNVPSPIIKFDNKTFYQIPKETLINIKEFTCNQAAHFEYYLNYEIIELKFQILREDKVIMKWEQNGSMLTELTKQNLNNTEKGDLLIITNSTVRYNGNLAELNPLIYEIN